MLTTAPEDVSTLPNRYAALESAYHLGYTEGAFGQHTPDPPTDLDEAHQSVWKDGFGEGLDRHEIYRQGFRAGVWSAAEGAGSPAPPEDLSPDQETAWAAGAAAGLGWAEAAGPAPGEPGRPETPHPSQGRAPATRTVTDTEIPPEAPTAFRNPYADRARAYAAGYLSGAFGVPSADTWAGSSESDAWNEGILDGSDRLRAYKNGFRDGIEARLARTQPAQMPGGLPPDQREAWRLGQAAGTAKADAVAAQLRAKASSVPGFVVVDGPIGSKRRSFGWAYWQEFGAARCVYLQAHESPGDDATSYRAFALDREIYPKYRELGYWDGPLGEPVADTAIAQDGTGRFGTFRDGEILWSPRTGAHALSGRILEHWKARGGLAGHLRYPTSSVGRLEVDRGVGATFEGGDIFFWDGAPAPVDVGDVRITYAGMNCFGDTDEAMEDEPYPIFTRVLPKRRLEDGSLVHEQGSSMIGPQEDAVGGGSYPRNLVVYEGRVAGLGGLGVLLMEHDSGDKNAYRAQVEAAVQTALGGLAAGATAVAGPAVGALVAWLGQMGAPSIVSAINDALGTGDETIGNHVHTLSPRRLIEMAQAAPMTEQRIAAFKFGQEPLLSGHDASYKVYFDVSFRP